jgi:hypothetical protein
MKEGCMDSMSPQAIIGLFIGIVIIGAIAFLYLQEEEPVAKKVVKKPMAELLNLRTAIMMEETLPCIYEDGQMAFIEADRSLAIGDLAADILKKVRLWQTHFEFTQRERVIHSVRIMRNEKKIIGILIQYSEKLYLPGFR